MPVAGVCGAYWRMTEMQAVIGRIQLKRMQEWQAARLNYAQQIWATAKQLPGLRVADIGESFLHAAYKCYVFVEGNASLRDKIMQKINEKGVPCFSGSCSEVYLEKAFDATGFRPKQALPNAKKLGDTSLMFLVHPTLTQAEIDKTCQVLKDVVTEFGG